MREYPDNDLGALWYGDDDPAPKVRRRNGRWQRREQSNLSDDWRDDEKIIRPQWWRGRSG